MMRTPDKRDGRRGESSAGRPAQSTPSKRFDGVAPADVLSFVSLDAVCRKLASRLRADETYSGAEAAALLASVTDGVTATLPAVYDEAQRDPHTTLAAAHAPRPKLKRRDGSIDGEDGKDAKRDAPAPVRVSAATLARRKRRAEEAAAKKRDAETRAAVEAGRKELLQQQRKQQEEQRARKQRHARQASSASADPHLLAIDTALAAAAGSSLPRAASAGSAMTKSTRTGVPQPGNAGHHRRRSSGTTPTTAAANGSRLPVRAAKPPRPSCPHCHVTGDPGDRYCSECGRVMVNASAHVAGDSDDSGEVNEPGRDRSQRPRAGSSASIVDAPAAPSDLALRLSAMMGTGTSVTNLAGALATPTHRAAGSGAKPPAPPARSPTAQHRRGGSGSAAAGGRASGSAMDSDLSMPSMDEILDGLAAASSADDGTPTAGPRSPSSRSPVAPRRGLPTSSHLASVLGDYGQWRELRWKVAVVGSRRCRRKAGGGVFVQFNVRCSAEWVAQYGRVQRVDTQVHRRFRDFLWLIDCLSNRVTGAVLPLLPARPRDSRDKFSKMALVRRRARLSMWLRLVTGHPAWRHAPELAVFLLADQRPFDQVRGRVPGGTVSPACPMPHALRESSWGVGDALEPAVAGDVTVVVNAPRPLCASLALMESAVPESQAPPDALVGAVISRTTALKSMLQASVSLVTTWAGQADAQAALGSALASLSTALSLAAPEPLAAAGAGGSDAGAGRRRAMSAASSGLGSADFAQAIGELSAPGRAARSSVGLQQPGVDELSFWGSQVFGAAERAVVYATTGDTQAPKGVVADVAWLESKCRARVVHTCYRFAAAARSTAKAERTAWLALQRSLRDDVLSTSFDPPLDLIVDDVIRRRGGPDPRLSRKGVCERTPFEERYAPGSRPVAVNGAASGRHGRAQSVAVSTQPGGSAGSAPAPASVPAVPVFRAPPPDPAAVAAAAAGRAALAAAAAEPRQAPAAPARGDDSGSGSGSGAGDADADSDDDATAWRDEEPGMPEPLGNVYAGIVTLYTPPPKPPTSPSMDGSTPSESKAATPRRDGTASADLRTPERLPRAVSLALTSNATSSPGPAQRAALSQRAMRRQSSGGGLPSPDTPALLSAPGQAPDVDGDEEARGQATDDESAMGDAATARGPGVPEEKLEPAPGSALVPIIAREVCLGRAQVGNHVVIDDDTAVSGHHAVMHVRRVFNRKVAKTMLRRRRAAAAKKKGKPGGGQPAERADDPELQALLRELPVVTQVRLSDLRSRNGTFVNDARLKPGFANGVVLRNGDRIRLGQTRLQFVAMR